MAEWDLVVIGGGAAGLSAGATAAKAGFSCLVIDRMGGGGELMNLGQLHDMSEDITGPDLAARLLEDAVAAGAVFGIAEVAELRQLGLHWHIATDDETHTARAVILAAGLAPGTLGLDNEADFEGRGLSHCAACDGPLYAGEPIVVAGTDRWAQQEAADLAGTASMVTLVTQGGPPPKLDGVTVLSGRITALNGPSGLASVTVQQDDRLTINLTAHGIFLQSGRRPALAFAPDTLTREADGRLITDLALQTNLPGIFAAGDARAGSPRTLAAAMKDGRHAAKSAYDALSPRSTCDQP